MAMVEVSAAAPTPWAVTCPEHGRVYLTEAEYRAQLGRVGAPWRCPVEVVEPPPIGICGEEAEFDDENWEARA